MSGSGVAYSWGANSDNRLMRLVFMNQFDPLPVPDATEVTHVGAGLFHSTLVAGTSYVIGTLSRTDTDIVTVSPQTPPFIPYDPYVPPYEASYSYELYEPPYELPYRPLYEPPYETLYEHYEAPYEAASYSYEQSYQSYDQSSARQSSEPYEYQGEEEQCPNDCSNQGQCIYGVCNCNSERSGFDCGYDACDPTNVAETCSSAATLCFQLDGNFVCGACDPSLEQPCENCGTYMFVTQCW